MHLRLWKWLWQTQVSHTSFYLLITDVWFKGQVAQYSSLFWKSLINQGAVFYFLPLSSFNVKIILSCIIWQRHILYHLVPAPHLSYMMFIQSEIFKSKAATFHPMEISQMSCAAFYTLILKFSLTYLVSLVMFRCPLELQIKFCWFGQCLEAQHEFVVTPWYFNKI